MPFPINVPLPAAAAAAGQARSGTAPSRRAGGELPGIKTGAPAGGPAAAGMGCLPPTKVGFSLGKLLRALD